MVDIETNPLYYATIGGLILGIATSLHYILKGNVTGMSGILYDIAFFNRSEFPNKLIIIGGMIMASGVFFDIFRYGTYNGFTPFGPKELISEQTSYLGYALAGLLVGFGTKLGNGCTSGHGLCGLPRLSIRSFVAVGLFLSTAIGIATLKYYVTLGPFSHNFNPQSEYIHEISANLCIAFGLGFLIIAFTIQKLYNRPEQQNLIIIRDNLISLTVGIIFGLGLLVAGMARRRNIIYFLSLGKDWNPSLLFVLGAGVLVNLVTFNYMIRVKKSPIYGAKLFNPENSVIDWKLVLGASTFGLGWGIGGLCPGPAFVLLSVFQLQIHVVWLAAVILGMFFANKLVQYTDAKSKVTDSKTPIADTQVPPAQQSSKIKINNLPNDPNEPKVNNQTIQAQTLNNQPQNQQNSQANLTNQVPPGRKQSNAPTTNPNEIGGVFKGKEIHVEVMRVESFSDDDGDRGNNL